MFAMSYNNAKKMAAVPVILCVVLVTWLPGVQCGDDTSALLPVVEQLSSKMAALTAKVDQQQSKMAAMESVQQQQARNISDLELKLQQQQSQLALQTPFVAFDVQYESDPKTGVMNHETMMFDHVTTNVGNGYDLHTGMFQAPVSGVYLFHVKVTPSKNGTVYVYLAKEGANVDSAYASDSSHQETGDSVRIMQVRKGERVWLKKWSGVTELRGWAHTKLSGFLLRATSV